MTAPHQETMTVNGFEVTVDRQLGHLMVAHGGTITWDELQAIKNAIWGEGTRAIEVYPVNDALVNSGNYRHLWRLGKGDFCPDLLAHEESDLFDMDGLENRHGAAWAEAQKALRNVDL